MASSRPPNVGILAMEVYVPQRFVTQESLEAVDECAGKYTKGLGQKRLGFVDDREDIGSVLLSAFANLLEKYALDPSTIGRLEVGSETLVDKSKSVKTTLLAQVVATSLEDELVPILVKTQQLQAALLAAPDAFGFAWNYLDAYLRAEHGDGALYRFLRQALTARRALLLIDGLDEGGAKRDEIEAHVAEVLARQGHVLLCTSRPAGLDVDGRFGAFRHLSLAPLSDAQQAEALTQRLDAARAEALAIVERLRPKVERVRAARDERM